jgi:hypothetical protein
VFLKSIREVVSMSELVLTPYEWEEEGSYISPHLSNVTMTISSVDIHKSPLCATSPSGAPIQWA